MSHVDVHKDLHSDQGARKGEHPGRAANPVVKVHDITWLEFEKPNLAAAEAFALAFGFATALRTPDELHLRGTDAGAPCVLIRRGDRSRFIGAAYTAADQSDVVRLANATGSRVRALPETLGGVSVDLVDPSGIAVRVVSGTHVLEPLPAQSPHEFNFGHELRRANTTQRPPREPARVQRLGHVVLQTTKYRQALDWYLEHLGLIVSDFMYSPGQRGCGPVMSFIRCDRGPTPADHHTLAMALGPSNRYVHSAYQVCDLDAIAAGSQYLKTRGYHHSWGIGRPHPGQPDLRLLARPGRLLGGALRRRRHVRLHARTRLGPICRIWAVAVGAAGHQRLPRSSARARIPARAAFDASARCATTTNSTWPACAACSASATPQSRTDAPILRTADAWWVQTPSGAAESPPPPPPPASCWPTGPPSRPPPTAATPCPVDSLHLVSPITVPCRVVAQMTNYASHVKDAGLTRNTTR